MSVAFLALGANQGDARHTMVAAIRFLAESVGVQLRRYSSFYTTKPLGPPDQPNYLNTVIEVETAFTAVALLQLAWQLETHFGRQRKRERWAARTVDCDILLYDDSTINTPTLTIPHYAMHERAFVLAPLAEIAPLCTMPDGRRIVDLLAACDQSGMVKQEKVDVNQSIVSGVV